MTTTVSPLVLVGWDLDSDVDELELNEVSDEVSDVSPSDSGLESELESEDDPEEEEEEEEDDEDEDESSPKSSFRRLTPGATLCVRHLSAGCDVDDKPLESVGACFSGEALSSGPR